MQIRAPVLINAAGCGPSVLSSGNATVDVLAEDLPSTPLAVFQQSRVCNAERPSSLGMIVRIRRMVGLNHGILS
jgi:hypothetical protein